jgi:hypothetical protein
VAVWTFSQVKKNLQRQITERKCICQRHRMLVGNVTYDEDGRALGGINCQCVDVVECAESPGRVMRWLEVSDYLPVFQPKSG